MSCSDVNDECKDVIKNRKKAERRFEKHPTSAIFASSGRKLEEH
jgi:hypothetical protein